MDNFWYSLPQPIIALAPMAGYSDFAFRSMVRSINPQVLLISEMISTEALIRNCIKTRKIFHYVPNHQPFLIQIFGNKPKTFAQTGIILSQEHVTGIDINMGCPAPKIIKSRSGAALLEDLNLAVACVEELKAHTHHPISIKTRLGYQDDDLDHLYLFIEKLIRAGVSAFTIHGRTYKQAFTGNANWDNIYKLKKYVGNKAIIIGNGDIKSITDVQDRLYHGKKIPQLDGVMIGRAAISDPWLLDDIYTKFHTTKTPKTIDLATKKTYMQQHITALVLDKGERVAVHEIRKFLLTYTKGLPAARQIRDKLAQLNDIHSVQNLIGQL